jgi:ribosomal protein S18 acetylase RimI-like enzyme
MGLKAYSIRILTPDDQPDWRALRLEALRAHPTAFLTTVEEQRAYSDQQDRDGLAFGNWRGLFRAGNLIGMGALIPMMREVMRHRMEVGALYLQPAYRGTGAAEHLMQALESEARDRDAKQLELEVNSDNAAAISFYERLGYERMGCKPRTVWTSRGPEDDFFYVKFLDGGSC